MALRARVSPTVGWLAALATVVVVFLLIGVVAAAISPSPSGPALSSYSTSSGGVAAWAELLRRDGHHVRQLRGGLSTADLPGHATLVMLGSAGYLSRADGRAIRAFLGRGGRLVLGGGLAVEAARVPGDVVAVPAPRYLENRALARGNNAYRALELVGPGSRPVIFDEALHGHGAATGLAALPTRWWVALAVLALAVVGWALSRAWRLGGSDPRLQAGAAPRIAYVEAMADTLARTASRDELRARLSEQSESVLAGSVKMEEA